MSKGKNKAEGRTPYFAHGENYVNVSIILDNIHEKVPRFSTLAPPRGPLANIHLTNLIHAAYGY